MGTDVPDKKFCNLNCRSNAAHKRSREAKKESNKLRTGKYCLFSSGIFHRKADDVWVAHISYGAPNYKTKRVYFKVSAYGEQTAKFAATLQRVLLLIRAGLWRIEDGDPFKILRYDGTWDGNGVGGTVDDASSPFLQYRDED